MYGMDESLHTITIHRKGAVYHNMIIKPDSCMKGGNKLMLA